MAVWQGITKRKITGKRLVARRKHRKHELGRMFLETKLGARRMKPFRCLGGTHKSCLLSEEYANVCDPRANTIKKAKITTVSENAANPHYVRRNVITKGAVIDTELGKARVTSRPGQDGTVNAVLIQ